MKLKKISLQDKRIFERYLNLSAHQLSAYAFANIYTWKNLFDISWQVIDHTLCIFFKDKIGAFLYLPPLSERVSPEATRRAFEILDGFNLNHEVSRIENVEELYLEDYRNLGYVEQERSSEYLYSRGDLVGLRGNAFKSKRSSFNYFVNNFNFRYRPYSSVDKRGCLRLYELWQKGRAAGISDDLYRGMLNDSYATVKVALDNCKDLGLIVRVVEIRGKIKAFTLGYKLSRRDFCVLYEITDLSIRGLAQFIFRKFCQEAKAWQRINIMDDSGLENLKRVKLSYRPMKLLPAYIIKRDRCADR